MPLKRNMLPNLNAVHKAKTKKASKPDKSQECEPDINGMIYHKTFLPKTEMDSEGRPINNIEGVDDTNLSLSMSNVLHKDLDRMKKDKNK